MKPLHTVYFNYHRAIIFYIIVILCNVNVPDNVTYASKQNKMVQARQLFYKSVEDRQFIKKAIAIFKEIGKNKKYEGVASTYIGSLTALKGKFAFFPITKYRHVMKGITLMDQGIVKSPHNIEARFIRGMTCYYLPFFFNRKKTAKNDFKVVVKRLSIDYRNYDSQLIMNITDFLLENTKLKAEEIELLKNIQNKIQKNEG